MAGGGKGEGEDPRNPFLLFNALLDLGEDLCGFAGTLHGGVFAVLLDEVMGTAANFQAREFWVSLRGCFCLLMGHSAWCVYGGF